jgi:transposase
MLYIEPTDRNQISLMNSLDDLVSPENPVRLIDILVEKIYNNQKEPRESNVGRPRYHEVTFLKLYLYGYLHGISSSRKLESESQRNIEVMWLLGKLEPDHWVISNYRKENGAAIKQVTKEFRKFLHTSGYIKGKTVSIDGTKIKANTNRDMLTVSKIKKRLEKMDEKLEEYFKKLIENDTIDEIEENADILSTTDINSDLLDKYIKLQQKMEKLQSSKEYLEKEKRNSVSPTDKEARLMRSRDGYIPAYNVQLAVDSENKMIVDSEVATDENDINQIEPMVTSIEEEIGRKPEEAILDKGYYNPSQIEKIETEGKVKCFVSIPSQKKEEITFIYNAEKDEYECSEGKPLILRQRNKKKKNTLADVYQAIECDGCKMREKCTKAKNGRIVHRYHNHDWVENYKKKMEQTAAREKMRHRKAIAEHPFGTLKYWMGKIPLLLRGKEKVATEINLYTTAYNIRRLLNIEDFDEIYAKIDNYNWVSV